MTDSINNKITNITESYILDVSVLQHEKEHPTLILPFIKGIHIPDSIKKYQNLHYDVKYDKSVARKYGIPPGIKLDTSPQFYAKIDASTITPNDIKLVRTINSKPYIEVVHFEGESLTDDIDHPDEPETSIHTRHGTYYYHAVGSGVFYPITPKTLVANNKIHALSILGFDFMSCLLNDDWGNFAFNHPNNLTTSSLFDISRKSELSQLIRAIKRYKSFVEFLSAFFKTDIYISTRSPKQARIDYFKPKLDEFLAVCANTTHTKYSNIYLSTYNHLILDYNLHYLSQDKYDTIILTHEPSSYTNSHNIEILDISKTLRESYNKLVEPKDYPTDFKYIKDFYSSYPINIKNLNILHDILKNEETSDIAKIHTYQGIKHITSIIPIKGNVIGSYAYGLQSIHTDIDIVFSIDKSHPTKQYLDKLTSIGFTNLTHFINDRSKLHRISGQYKDIDFDLDFFYEQTHLYKVFMKELDVYSVLKNHPYVCNTIRLINQWYYNRKLAGSEFGYLHSTLFYALAIESLDKLSTINNTSDTLRKFIEICASYDLNDFRDLSNKYDIMLIENYAYSLLINELARANKHASNYNFERMYKKISKEKLTETYPNKISFTFKDPSSLNRSNDMKAIKYLIEKIPKEFRLYLSTPKQDSIKLYLFSKEKIQQSIIDAFVEETLKYNPKTLWDVK